jgi:lysophospholipase L1-like esterase
MPKTLRWYGDSVLAGYPLPNGAQGAYPAIAGALLGPSVVCENHGIGGTNTREWLFGQGAVPRNWEAELARPGAEYVLINTGINDAFLPGYGPADHAWAYRELTRIAWANGKHMIFVTPNPIALSHNGALWELKHQIDGPGGVAESVGVPVIKIYDAIAIGCPQWRASLPDQVHPNAEMHRYMGHVAFMTLAPILRAAGLCIP